MLWKGDMVARGDVNKQKFNTQVIKKISERLLTMKNQIPCEFVRKPRSIYELSRWKATEYRLFLLYVGPISIHSLASNKIYQHFLYLNIAMTIFLSPNYNNLAHFAKLLMHDFVKEFGSLYGEHFISHNIHSLIHLHEDYENFGCLDTVSCFKFENYMSELKKMVCKNDKPLQQVRRYEERNSFLSSSDNLLTQHNEDFLLKFENLHTEGPLVNGTSSPQYKVLILDKITIKTHSDPNSYIGLKKDGIIKIFKVVNICYSVDEKKNILLCREFKKIDNLFDRPLKSERIGIYKVSEFSKQICVCFIEDIITKYMILSTTDLDFKLAYPIIHFNN